MKLKRRICQSTRVLDKKISLTVVVFPGPSIQCVTRQTANVFWPQFGPRMCVCTLLLIILADDFCCDWGFKSFNCFSRSFNTVCYSADGKCVLAAGRSKNVCIYSIADQILIKKFEISCNMSFDGMEVSSLTLKAPPIICGRRQFQILLLFQK